jgi:cytochrome c-550 PedF
MVHLLKNGAAISHASPSFGWHGICAREGKHFHTSGDKLMHTPSFLAAIILAASMLAAGAVHAHGDVTPQAVDTKSLPPLGDKWVAENPYRDNKEAQKVGASAFGANCARCHGIEAISGGIAPDLRLLDRDCMTQKVETKKKACFKDNDDYFANSVRKGKVRNGAVYMPPFDGILNQEAVWAIKAYLETKRELK